MLRVESLRKRYASRGPGGTGSASNAYAVDGVSFEVGAGEFFTLLGPSGCGKTTTLRAIAGLESPDEGTIVAAGKTLFDASSRIDMPANDRGLGMVFQSYAIWPHMSVFKNVSFPLDVRPRRRRLSAENVRERVRRVLEVTELAKFEKRPATALSGGQQQRLALARALVMEPDVLLLDEPLSNLDAVLRDSMRFELKRLQRELGMTTIYVTHDQAEALAMSDRISVMSAGKVEQIGDPRQIYMEPATEFVARFIGRNNLIAGTVSGVSDGKATVDLGAFSLTVAGVGSAYPGAPVTVAVRPEAVQIAGADRTGAVEGVVGGVAYGGEAAEVMIDVRGTTLRARTDASTSPRPGDRVFLHVVADGATAFSSDDGSSMMTRNAPTYSTV